MLQADDKKYDSGGADETPEEAAIMDELATSTAIELFGEEEARKMLGAAFVRPVSKYGQVLKKQLEKTETP